MKIPDWWPLIFINPITGVLLVGLLVHSCAVDQEKEVQERESRYHQIEKSMPDGCKIHQYGEYRGIHNLTVIQCDGKSTSSSNYEELIGKYWRQRVTLTIEGK